MLKQASAEITRVSAPNLVLPDDAAGWEEGFTGVNTRWESIGIMLCGLAGGLLNVNEKNFGTLGLATRHPDRRKAMLCLNEAIECCIELCRHTLSTIVCTLLAKAFQLDAAIHGDTSKSLSFNRVSSLSFSSHEESRTCGNSAATRIIRCDHCIRNI